MAEAERKEKTRRHWRVLRAALLSKAQDDKGESASGTASAISTQFFPLFAASPVRGAAQIQHEPADGFEWTAYDLSLPSADALASPAKRIVYVHEKQKQVQRVSVAELLSHQVNNGVDNTGNIRTWPSEQILLWLMLQNRVFHHAQTKDEKPGTAAPINCCELGSGMAGLASLGLLAHAPFAIDRMLITDGNPRCVDSLTAAVSENQRQGMLARSESAQVSAALLRWDRNAHLPDAWRNRFDLVFASDCLFFEDFHVDLVHTIKLLLRPKIGRCLLLQPSRGGAMERFCASARANGLSIEVTGEYDPEISRRHREYLQTRSDYVPDVHFPQLVIASLP